MYNHFFSLLDFKPTASFEFLFRTLEHYKILTPVLNLFSDIGINSPMFFKILQATDETLLMTFISALGGIILGLPLGILLFITRKNEIAESPITHTILSAIINIFRAIPFIILIVWMIPFTRALVGTSIGLTAALVPLSIGVAPFIARMVENALLDIPKGLIEAARAMGASTCQVIYKVLIPESLPILVNSATITIITLISYSAMAGAVGAGGLGQLAYQYGYTMNKIEVMNTVLILLIIIVFIVQFIGNWIVRKIKH